jgi:hypothetical protein
MMDVIDRDEQPRGAWVTYECPNDRCAAYEQSDHQFRWQVREFESSD